MLIAMKLDAFLEKSLMILTIVLLMIVNIIIFISIKVLNTGYTFRLISV